MNVRSPEGQAMLRTGVALLELAERPNSEATVAMELRLRHFVRAAIGIAGVGVVVLGLSRLSDRRNLAYESHDPPAMAGTVGYMRHEKLEKLTAKYESENPHGEVLFVAGERLAPLDYLNGELRHMETSWRVRIEDGEIAFVEVS